MLWSRLHNSLFVAFSRPIFLLGLAVIILNLFVNNNPTFKSFLSSKLFLILGRFSYAAYLIFPIVIAILVSSMDNSLYLNYNEMFWLFGYNLVATFFVAFIIYLYVEKPIANVLDAFVLKKKDKLYELH